MKYKDYIEYTKTYVVIHNIGFGVMEDPYEEKEIVFETDSLEEAKLKAKELKILNNTKEEIESSWIPNTYQININTLSKKGKQLLEELEKEFNEKLEEIKKDPNYKEIKLRDIIFHTKGNNIFNGERSINGNALESYRMVFLNLD